MEEKKNKTNQLDESANRHRQMTEERKNKRKRILKVVAAGAGVAVGVGALVARCNFVTEIIHDYSDMILGGAMGQWEEIPMQEQLNLQGDVTNV